MQFLKPDCSIYAKIAQIRNLDPALETQIDRHLKTGLRYEWKDITVI